MKTALVIILAVFVAFVGLAVIGSLLPKDPATPIVTQTVAPTPTPAPIETMSSDELTVYAYVEKHYNELTALFDDLTSACDNVDLSGVNNCAERYIRLTKEWNKLPEVGGQVGDLEQAYTDTGDSLRILIIDALKLGTGGNVNDHKLTNDIANYLNYLKTCRDELDSLQEEAQSSY